MMSLTEDRRAAAALSAHPEPTQRSHGSTWGRTPRPDKEKVEQRRASERRRGAQPRESFIVRGKPVDIAPGTLCPVCELVIVTGQLVIQSPITGKKNLSYGTGRWIHGHCWVDTTD